MVKGERLTILGRKVTSGILLSLLLFGILTLAFEIEPVRASGTIYIRADGSIDPSAANITTEDNITYTFTDDNYEGIVIERSNIIIDGNGYAVQGTGTGEGFHMDLVHNVTIKNTEITSFSVGIWVGASSYNNTIIGNNITDIHAYGLYPGIILYHSSNNTVIGNNITNSYFGIYIVVSENNTLRSNYLSENQYNFGIYGATQLRYYVQDIDSSNTVDGKPVYYWVDHENESVPADAGYVALVHSSNITVQNLDLKNNIQLLLLAYTNNSLITGNNMTGGGEGRNDGITVLCSSNNTIAGNNITDSDSGIEIWYATDNTIAGNNMTENTYGVDVRDSSYNNTIVGNNIVDNGYGFYVEGDSANTIYHNNLIDNFMHAMLFSGTDSWDNGYPSGGNYWNDYTGIDEKHGPYQNETGSDGIGDTPYTIAGAYGSTYQDRYPLANPWTPTQTNVAANGQNHPVTIVTNGTITQIVAEKNELNLTVSGPTGSAGYVLAVFPSINTTSLKVYDNGSEIKPPPYPVINTNGTHYFIYFELTFSTHQITILYAPTDLIAPITSLTIGEPQYDGLGKIYVTLTTQFVLTANDNVGGTGIASIIYRIHNQTFDSGLQTYTQPFKLSGLADGQYSVEYYSTDNAGNVENKHTVQVTLFSWTYIFTDSYGRGTALRINTIHKLFQFVAPHRSFSVKQDPKMYIRKNTISINFKDSEISLHTLAVDTRIGFCLAYAEDLGTGETYLLKELSL